MMDLSKLSIDELKKLRSTYQRDLVSIKEELALIRNSLDNSDSVIANEIESILVNRCPESMCSEESDASDDYDPTEEDYLKAITDIKSLDITMKPIQKKEDGNEQCLYLYTCKIKFDYVLCELEYESNQSPNEITNPMDENITKLNIKILRPNIQSKLQKGVDFFQQSPNCFGSAIIFLRSIYDAMETRSDIVSELHKHEKYIVVLVSKNSEQHSIFYKSDFDHENYLHIKWNFKFEMQTGMARDLFTAKIMRADDILLEEMKPLIEKLCSDKFSLESSATDKVNQFLNILKAIKDCDTRTHIVSP